VRIKSHRVNEKITVNVRGSSKEIPQGAYVKVIRPEYLPRGTLEEMIHFVGFSPESSAICYTAYGLAFIDWKYLEVES
jgi:hypothetical protein